jgi:methionyl-tRNA formyltransferase
VTSIVYLGTPHVAVPPLQALIRHGFDVALVVTRPDKRRGRGSTTSASPVKEAALHLGLTVSHSVDDVVAAGADLGVVVAFGQLIRPHVLAATPMVNLHFSLLPRWRGAAPVERAILAGDTLTGVCVMEVVEQLDAGGIYASLPVAIGHDDTAESLRNRLVVAGTELLVDCLRSGLGVPVPQVGEPVYAAKITPDDVRLVWTDSAETNHRRVRVGGAWTTFRGKRLKVIRADIGVGQGGLTMQVVQPEGSSPMSWRDFANGYRPLPTEQFE